MPSALTSTGGTIVPHVLLPLLQILALFLPPFRLRAAIFVPLILILVYQTWTNLFSSAPDVRMILLSQWPWYLGTIAKLALGNPERDCWRTDRRMGEALEMAGFLEKFKWAGALYCSPRGVGWSFRVRKLPRQEGCSRWAFVVRHLRWVGVCWMALDVFGIYGEEYFYKGTTTEEDLAGLTIRTTNEVLRFGFHAVYGLFTPYFSLNLLYSQVAVGCVLLGLGAPKDWPPLFGNVGEITTLRAFWNTWWHQCVRNVYVSYSNALTDALGLNRDGWLASYTRLYFTFLVSGLGHGMVIYAMPHGPNHTMYHRFWMFFLCFAIQAPAIHLEDFAIWCYAQLVSGIDGLAEDQTKRQTKRQIGVSRSHKRLKSKRWHRYAGRFWLIIWVLLHAEFMTDPCLKSGLARTSPIPFSVLRPLVTYLGLTDTLEMIIKGEDPLKFAATRELINTGAGGSIDRDVMEDCAIFGVRYSSRHIM